MTRLKKKLLILFALVLIVKCIPFSAAQSDEDDDDDDSEETTLKPTTKKPNDIWKGKVCTINNALSPYYKVYMKSMWGGFRVSYKRSASKGSKWIITPVQVGGKSYFEFYNEEMKTYMGTSKSSAKGNNANYLKTKSTKTLFKIDPPKQDVPVYISSFNGKFLNKPNKLKRKKNVVMDSKKKTKWVMICY
jgi:hypothetical protein